MEERVKLYRVMIWSNNIKMSFSLEIENMLHDAHMEKMKGNVCESLSM